MKAIKYIAAAMAVASLATASAQNVWTLDSCISYAVSHNINIRQRVVDGEMARQTVTEAKDAFLPTLSAGASQNFDFGRGLTSENTYANRNTSTFGWNANMSLPLFQGLSDVRQLAWSKVNLQATLEQVEAAKDDLTLNVISQYLQVLYSREISLIAHDQTNLSAREVERRKTLLAGGKIPELDLMQAEAQLASDQLTAVTADNDLRLALLSLTELLQLPYDESFTVQDVDGTPGVLPSVDEVFANAMQFNHSVRAADLSLKAAEKNIAVARTGYIPRLSFQAGLGSNYYRVRGYDNAGFGEQMRQNFSKMLGFSLSVPIFDAFSTRNRERRARAATVTADLALDNARTTLYNNISRAYVQAMSARAKAQTGEVSVATAKAAFDAMEKKYNLGRATATEYEQTKTALFRARAELVQARYESLLRARILDFYNSPTGF